MTPKRYCSRCRVAFRGSTPSCQKCQKAARQAESDRNRALLDYARALTRKWLPPPCWTCRVCGVPGSARCQLHLKD
jgi:hypothetical protein